MDKKYNWNIPRKARVCVSVLLALTLLMGVCGCMKNPIEQAGSNMYDQIDKYTEESALQMQAYMEEKYGEEFSLVPSKVTFFPGTPHGQYVTPVSHPEWVVNVKYDPGNTVEPFTDNYVAFLKMDEVHDYLLPYFQSVYGEECRLFVREPSNATLPSSLNKVTDVETYLSVVSVGVSLFTTADPKKRDEDAKKLWNLDDLANYSISTGIYYFTSEDFQSETAVTGQWNLETELPYLYRGTLWIDKYTREEGYKEVNWREGSTSQA